MININANAFELAGDGGGEDYTKNRLGLKSA